MPRKPPATGACGPTGESSVPLPWRGRGFGGVGAGCGESDAGRSPEAAWPAGGSWEAGLGTGFPEACWQEELLLAGRTERYYFREKNEIPVIAYSSCRNVGASQPGPRGGESVPAAE